MIEKKVTISTQYSTEVLGNNFTVVISKENEIVTNVLATSVKGKYINASMQNGSITITGDSTADSELFTAVIDLLKEHGSANPSV